MEIIKNLYNYRELLTTSVNKDVGGKYKNSFLGVLWSFLNPLLQIAIYAIVFPLILRNNQENYVIFLCCGLIPWNFFATAINRSAFSFVENGNIIKKVYFPREILPISTATSGLVNFLISTPIILMFLLFSGIGFSKYILFLPVIAIIQYLLTLAIIMITSAINVYIRDAEYIINFFVTMLFYATPVLYSADLFPKQFRQFLYLNPMTTIINGYRDIFYYKQMPDYLALGIVFIISILLLLLGFKIFRKLEKGFAEEV